MVTTNCTVLKAVHIYIHHLLYVHKCGMCSSLAPANVNITDVTCDAVNLINQCDVQWNVSVHSYFGKSFELMYVRTYIIITNH